MNGLTAACGLALLTLVLSLVLKKDAPAIAALLAQGGITGSLYLPVCKALGVAVVVRVMSALCKDAGQSALAAKLEIAGAMLALSLCLPLLEQVLGLVADWTV